MCAPVCLSRAGLGKVGEGNIIFTHCAKTICHSGKGQTVETVKKLVFPRQGSWREGRGINKCGTQDVSRTPLYHDGGYMTLSICSNPYDARRRMNPSVNSGL